jgi:hypothetical protein
VLGRGLRRTARVKRQPELMPCRLRTQPLEQLCRRLVRAHLTQQTVHLLIEPRVLHEVAGIDGTTDVVAQHPQRFGIVGGEVLGGLARAEGFESDAHLDDLDGLVHADRAHAGTLVRQPLDEPLAGEVQQRRAHSGARRTEPVADVGLDESLVRGELAAEDRVTDERRQIGARRKVGLGEGRCRNHGYLLLLAASAAAPRDAQTVPQTTILAPTFAPIPPGPRTREPSRPSTVEGGATAPQDQEHP